MGRDERAARIAAWLELTWCLAFWTAVAVAMTQQNTVGY